MLKRETTLYVNYNPSTGKFYDPIKPLDPDTPNRRIRMRYISKDHEAAVIRYFGVDEKGKQTKLSQWGIVPRKDISVTKKHKRR